MMTAPGGIELDAYLVVDRACPMTVQVDCAEARIELGHGTGSVHLTASEEGLARLLELARVALADLRADTAGAG
jgi:hypothetical protein